MYIKTIDAIRKWMLFRPMVPDNRDILFSGSITTTGDFELDFQLSADVEHLTCFIGGMVGMSAKIFGIKGDLEIAKKLADGCVWAYESTLTGIMPEGATVMPCKSSEHCTWNETAYWEFLDPTGPQRDKNLEEYIANRAVREAEKKAQEEAAEAALKAEADLTYAKVGSDNSTSPLSEDQVSDYDLDAIPDSPGSAALKKDEPVSLHKRQTVSSPKLEVPKAITHNFQSDLPAAKPAMSQDTHEQKANAKSLYQQKSEHTESELASMAEVGRPAANIPVHPHASPSPTTQTQVFYDPGQPLSHKEYVEQIIKQQSLPPGFATIKSRKYILR
jgi:mannosyl-oligosaccharide alpha-1,2-mannosidase